MRYWNAFVGDEPHRTVSDVTLSSWEAARAGLLAFARVQLKNEQAPDGCPHCVDSAEQVVADLVALPPESRWRGHIGVNEFVLRSAVLR